MKGELKHKTRKDLVIQKFEYSDGTVKYCICRRFLFITWPLQVTKIEKDALDYYVFKKVHVKCTTVDGARSYRDFLSVWYSYRGVKIIPIASNNTLYYIPKYTVNFNGRYTSCTYGTLKDCMEAIDMREKPKVIKRETCH